MAINDAPVAEPIGEDQARILLPIATVTLASAESLKANLYIRPASGGPPVLYWSRERRATAADLQRLKSLALDTVYISPADYGAYQEYLRANLKSLLNDDSRPVATRFEFLGEVARQVLRHAFETDNVHRIVADVRHLVDHMLWLAVQPTPLLFDLYGVLRHDATMFSHCFNVAVYGLLLAKAWGLADETDLHRFGVALLLHDIGKLRIPSQLLAKPWPLTDVEQRVVRRHPQNGFERLCRRPDLTRDQLLVVYQHHERLDGRGYPVGLPASEIHPWARLCAVVNVFDLAASPALYRRALPVPDALEHVQLMCGTALDEEMVSLWTQLWQSPS